MARLHTSLGGYGAALRWSRDLLRASPTDPSDGSGLDLDLEAGVGHENASACLLFVFGGQLLVFGACRLRLSQSIHLAGEASRLVVGFLNFS